MALISRAEIIAEARSWVGTPYHHQASRKGAGADCLGLVRGVWRACLGTEPEAPPAYSADWHAEGSELLYEALARHMCMTSPADAAPGDVLIFRMHSRAPARHAAILVAPERIVHAYWSRAIVESRLGPFWRKRIAAAFAFPGVA